MGLRLCQWWCQGCMNINELGTGRVLPWGGQTDRSLALCALSKYCFWVFFLTIKWFKTASILMGLDDVHGHCVILLCRISLGKGIFAPMGVDCRSSRRSSWDVPVSWLVLTYLTCCSMKPLDQKKWGEDVVWLVCWHWRNCWNLLEAKGGPLAVLILLGVCTVWFVINCCFGTETELIWTWFLREKDIYWKDFRWGGTLCHSSATGHWRCLGAAWAGSVGKPCA